MSPEEIEQTHKELSKTREWSEAEQLEDDRMEEDMTFGLTDPETIQKFGGKVVAIWKKVVWGAGDTYAEALRKALKRAEENPSTNNPSRGAFAFVPVPSPIPAGFSYPTY